MHQRLDPEQAIQWIKVERLPSFLDSDCYHEYRLSNLLSQVGISNLHVNALASILPIL